LFTRPARAEKVATGKRGFVHRRQERRRGRKKGVFLGACPEGDPWGRKRHVGLAESIKEYCRGKKKRRS